MRDERIENEFGLFRDAAAALPARLSPPSRVADDLLFTIFGVPALTGEPPPTSSPDPDWSSSLRSEHAVRVRFPRYFPAMPIEAFVQPPVFHPNAHPETGFLCLWSTHRVGNSVLNSLARILAILAWQLVNWQPEHVMQPAAKRWYDRLDASTREGSLPLGYVPLPIASSTLPPAPTQWRRRLS